jgi:PKD repeat protein
MKKIFTLLFFFLITSFTTTILANSVYVAGYVLNANGSPAVNQAVTISNDSLSQGNTCGVLSHVKYTNSNGFFSDTLVCTGAITSVRISTPNCNGTLYTTTVPVNVTSQSVTLTIQLTCSGIGTCAANYTFNVVSGGSVQFTNTSAANSTITSYKWTFGDGTSSDLANPLHVYSVSGTYNACLKIISTGCSDSICKVVTVNVNPPSTCTAYYTYTIPSGSSVLFVNASVASNNIAYYSWSFGDGGTATIANPAHTYATSGTYNACLKIISSTGCTDSVCKSITVTAPPPTPACNAEYQFARDSANYKLYKFYAGVNTTYPNNDPVIERKWRFGDGDSLIGNVQNPTHLYAVAGTYNVCLRVKTQGGCVSELCKVITVVNPITTACYAAFTYVPQSSLISFNSNNSYSPAGDSIILRRWNWGDSSAQLLGNVVAPQHQYAQPGIYTVCLTIKTASGCEKTTCLTVTATNINSNCVPQFLTQRLSTIRTVAFSSGMSWVPANDSIIERKWKFGDGSSTLTGNVVNIQHQYPANGVYTACLWMKTALGCINEVCKPVILQDSIVQPPAGVNEPVRIINLYPNPVSTTLTTVIWSANNNISAELGIYDIYGVRKWYTTKNLLQGNNITAIPVGGLLTGPYIFKVTTVYGTKSRPFFKL